MENFEESEDFKAVRKMAIGEQARVDATTILLIRCLAELANSTGNPSRYFKDKREKFEAANADEVAKISNKSDNWEVEEYQRVLHAEIISILESSEKVAEKYAKEQQ